MKPYYQDSHVTIYHGDSRELLCSRSPVDAVITDPPYGETALDWDVWPDGWPGLCRDLAPQLWCFGSMRMFWDRVAQFSDWKLAQDMVWEKHNGSGIRNDRFRRVHELAIHFYRGDWGSLHKAVPRVEVDDSKRKNIHVRASKPQHFNGIETGSGYQFDGTRLMRSVIRERSCHRGGVHPTQKPENVVRPLIEYSVPPGGSVLDPFLGSGTTLAVAKSLGRRGVGIEGIERHCEQAALRCQAVAVA
jgi:site-specific DNA-methyltransferase (adenine-specific)